MGLVRCNSGSISCSEVQSSQKGWAAAVQRTALGIQASDSDESLLTDLRELLIRMCALRVDFESYGLLTLLTICLHTGKVSSSVTPGRGPYSSGATIWRWAHRREGRKRQLQQPPRPPRTRNQPGPLVPPFMSGLEMPSVWVWLPTRGEQRTDRLGTKPVPAVHLQGGLGLTLWALALPSVKHE